MKPDIKKDFGTGRKPRTDLSSLVYGKIPPQAIEMEEAVLGAIMLEKDLQAEVFSIIPNGDCFYVDGNRKIYDCVKQMYREGRTIDLLTVTEGLRTLDSLELVGGPYYLTRLTMAVVSSAHIEAHARIVMEKFYARELIRIYGQGIASAYEDSTDVFDLMDYTSGQLFDITSSITGSEMKTAAQIVIESQNDLDAQRNNTVELTGVTTGMPGLDEVTGGWQKTDLIILAARPSVGKTAYALNLATFAATSGVPVAVFSLEMGRKKLINRIKSNLAGVEMELFKTPRRMSPDEYNRVIQAGSRISQLKLFIDDTTGLTIFQLRTKARKLKQKNDIGLIIIDYLQLMKGEINRNGNREQEISQISRDLKGLAKDLDLPIIALSQLNRSVESRSDKRPGLADLRESGAIEQDADMVMFLYRPEYYGLPNDEMGQTVEGETHLNIAKYRDGSTEGFKMIFEKRYQRFKPFSEYNPFAGANSQIKQDNPYAGINKGYVPKEKWTDEEFV